MTLTGKLEGCPDVGRLVGCRVCESVKRPGQSGKPKPMVGAENDSRIEHSPESSWVAKMSGDLWAEMTTRMSEWNTT